jgi:hypothetical protein
MSRTQPANARELAERFSRVDPAYGPVPIWWWSGARLERNRLRWQMEQLLAGGVHQAVIMCLAPRGPLYGSQADDPPFFSEAWWELFLTACEDANDLGFKFWLYDQYGFSGANFQGQLVAAHPQWSGQEIQRLEREVGAAQSVRLELPHGATALAAYVVIGDAPARPVPLDPDGSVTWSGEPGRLHLCYAQERGFDYYNPEACAALIDTVLGEFRRRADKWFGPVITGLFQDELPHMPTWGPTFAAAFAATNGYDLIERLPCLWEGDGDAAARVRRDYHAQRAVLARAAFFVPYGHWARSAGLIAGFDQQTPAREGDPASATALYGDYLATHDVYSAPGSDHWGDPKIHSSLAHAHGHPRTWIEAFHSSGWGGTLEETYDWLGPFLRRGANLYDPHAVYYATVGGWWEWAPPSTCFRQPYWPDYKVFADAVTRLCSLLSAGTLVADTVLVFPTSSAQADLRIDGGYRIERRTSEVYHQLNGSTSWFDERPGVLDRAHHDYEILDEQTLLAGDLNGDRWHAAGGTFRNVVLPATTSLDGAFAAKLANFAENGGTVISVGPPPERFVGTDGHGGRALLDAVARGTIRLVDAPGEVPAELVRGPVSVEADAPFMLRRYGDALVVLLVAHDEQTGTTMPVFDGNAVEDRIAGSFSWSGYWKSFSRRGYAFRPVGDRRARVRVRGLAGVAAQRWDPRSGERVGLDASRSEPGDLEFDVPFADGSMAVVVVAGDLPGATRVDPIGPSGIAGLDDGWVLEACSTLDNRWGDLGDPAVRTTLPIEVWRLEHARTPAGDDAVPTDGWEPTVATYGPYLRVRGPEDRMDGPSAGTGGWAPYELSLSRGIRKDPLHHPSLGPKGTVPEEFLRWEGVRPGQWVAFGAVLELAEGAGRHLVVGAAADRSIYLDGRPLDAAGTGYWTISPFPDGARRVRLEVWLRRDEVAGAAGGSESPSERELRATFAVVDDTVRFARPEWLEPADGGGAATTVRFTVGFHLDTVPADTVVQVGTEGPCAIVVNGAEIGRQGAFEPYSAQRRPQVMPYDLAPRLRPGRNELTLQIDDLGGGVAALVDSRPVADGGPGLVTGLDWTCSRDDAEVGVRLRREQWLDPRWVCRFPRPHPLPRAAWLDPATAGDGVVVDLVPDAGPEGARTEWLRFTAPVGASELRVRSRVPFVAVAEGREVAPVDGLVRFDRPLPAGSVVHLRFSASGGERAGGLLEGPVEATTVATPGPLVEWEELGLRALGGYVAYRRVLEVGETGPDRRVFLDLGYVRGSAEVRVNGGRPTTLVWSPYRTEITSQLVPGANELEVIVRGTLAGYLDDASPTPAVYQGQARHGMLGPVRLVHYDR